jgi:hypothetical protein
MRLDPLVQSTVDAYLADAGDLIDGLYLFGSVALDDFRPGYSDIDFVALVTEPVDEAALASVHAGLPGPALDGIYLTREQLAAGPLAIEPTIFARERELHSAGRFEHTPVTWHTLADGGVTCHGPALAELTIWTSPAALTAAVRDNLDSYWRPLLAQGSAAPVEPFPTAIMWVVLGIPRLHYTLATGRITSKTGGGEHALAVFDEQWHPIIRASLTQRSGGAEPSPELWPQALAFLDMAIVSAAALP